MKEHSVMMKYRSGLTDKLPAIRNGDLVYGRLSLQRSRYAALYIFCLTSVFLYIIMLQ